MIRIGLVGYGYWGPNLARVLEENDEFELVAISDASHERGELARRRHKAKVLWGPGENLIRMKALKLDAVAIATPVLTHYTMTSAALAAGLHVLVSKPLTDDTSRAQDLCAQATMMNAVLMVDHTFLFTPAVRKMRELIDNGALGGRLLFVDSVRINLGLVQPDVDVLWDLAPHDVSILLHLIGRPPVEVAAVAADPVGAGRASLAHLTLWFEDGLTAHVHVNWCSPVKVRRMLVAGDRRMIVYDDVEPIEKLRLYDSGVDVDLEERQVGYRTGDVWSPKLELREALAAEVDHFAECIHGGKPSAIASGRHGVDVVRIIELAGVSLQEGGRRVPV